MGDSVDSSFSLFDSFNQWLNNPLGALSNVGKSISSTFSDIAKSPALEQKSIWGSATPDGWQQGWAMPAIGAASGLLGAWNGWQGMNLAKDQFDFSKQAYNTNLEQQKQLLQNRYADNFAYDNLLNNRGLTPGTDAYNNSFQQYLNQRTVNNG